jgi:hypothetical protein
MSALASTTKVPREYATRGEDLGAAAARGRSLWSSIERQVRSSNADVAVLSGEYLYALRAPQVEELRALLAGAFSTIEVVCYVRDPAAYYVAMLQQGLKASHTILPPGQFQLRARTRLSRYLEAFDGRVSVRSAQRADLVDGDIVRDFVQHHLPEGAASMRASSGEVNPSMSAEAMCIMQDLRRHGWPDDDGRFAAESTLVWRRLNEERTSVPQTAARLRPEIRDALLRAHQRDLDFLAERFGVHLPGHEGTAGGAGDPAGWLSSDVRDVVAVDPDDVERVRAALLRDLAGRGRARWRRR